MVAVVVDGVPERLSFDEPQPVDTRSRTHSDGSNGKRHHLTFAAPPELDLSFT
jgi:hypothetical protein